ncbi:MAG: sulfatase, partial [Thermoanaerobaculia bacterium]|nr:sulfatase [Thermoanaerobaculia bacterium]
PPGGAAAAGAAPPPRSGLRLTAPTLRTVAAGPRPAPGPAPRPTPSGGPPDIVVYLVDTLRADHLGCYGYHRPTSPQIDRFAEDATLFTGALAQSSWTRPAVATLFTGLYPEVHGVTGRQSGLPAGVATLAELLREAGYATAAVSTNPYVTPAFGLDRGFDTFVELPVDRRTEEVHQLSDRLNREAFAWLDARPPGRPFFLYLHSTDPHLPYAPRSPYRERFARPGSAAVAGTKETVYRLTAGELEATVAVREGLIDLYDAEIAFNDAAFGELRRRLEELGLWESALVVLLADHGEEFGDHGLWTHGRTLYSEQLAMPLVVRLPGGRGAGRRVDAPVSQVDLLPTLLDYLGVGAPEAVQGRSFLAAFEPGFSPSDPPPAIYAHLGINGRRHLAVTRGRRKVVYRAQRLLRPMPRVEQYDLERDPGERRNLAYQEPVWTGYLLSLSRLRELWPALHAEDVELSEELQKNLEALGYVH